MAPDIGRQGDRAGNLGTGAFRGFNDIMCRLVEQSVVVICVDGSGHYEYRGMRVQDSYALKVPRAAMVGGKYVARSAGFTYIFSAKELMILQGWGWVIRKEPMVAFVVPRQPAGG